MLFLGWATTSLAQTATDTNTAANVSTTAPPVTASSANSATVSPLSAKAKVQTNLESVFTAQELLDATDQLMNDLEHDDLRELRDGYYLINGVNIYPLGQGEEDFHMGVDSERARRMKDFDKYVWSALSRLKTSVDGVRSEFESNGQFQQWSQLDLELTNAKVEYQGISKLLERHTIKRKEILAPLQRFYRGISVLSKPASWKILKALPQT